MKWQPLSRVYPKPAAPLREWLADRGSLTDRLIRHSDGEFRVGILRKHWGRCRPDESKALRIPPHHRVLVREVILYGKQQPWVYARSILPACSLQHSLKYLGRLGNKPLGAVLFSDPFLQRSEIEITCLQPGDLPVSTTQVVWGRRSVFCLQHQLLLVSEIFLPDFVAGLG